MKLKRVTPEEDLLKRGIEVLFRELGKNDAVRFLTIPRKKRLESVERHRKWQDTLNKDAFFDEVFGSPNDDHKCERPGMG